MIGNNDYEFDIKKNVYILQKKYYSCMGIYKTLYNNNYLVMNWFIDIIFF